MLDVEKTGRTVMTPDGERRLLWDISFHLPAGRVLTLMGPSGSGKSTLLRLLNRLDEPSAGRILLAGRDTRTIDPLDLRRRVGLVFQIPALFAGTVAMNVAYGLRLRRQLLPEAKLLHLLELVNLPASLAGQEARTLSVGQAQRVAIARALANEPEVLLLDEPTAALDPHAAAGIIKLVNDLRTTLGVSIIFVTHFVQQAGEVADLVVLLAGGTIAEQGPAHSFFAGPRTDAGRRFLRGDLA